MKWDHQNYGKMCCEKIYVEFEVSNSSFTISCNFYTELRGLRNQHKANGAFKFVDGTLFLPSVSVTDGVDICLVLWILWSDEESNSSPNLQNIVKKRLPPDVAAAATRDSRQRSQMRKAAHNGCCRQVSQSHALSLALWKLLISEDLVYALLRIESPLVKLLSLTWKCGIGVDVEACFRARSILGKKLKELRRKLSN